MLTRLEDVCALSRPEAEAAAYATLRDACQQVGAGLGLSGLEAIGLFGFAAAGALALIVVRGRQGEAAGVVVGNALEGAVLAAIGFLAGATFGLVVAQVVPAGFLGFLLAATGAVGLVFVGFGLYWGAGNRKALAVVEGILLAAGLAVLAVLCAAAAGGDGPAYERYLNAVPLGLGVLGAIDGILAAALRAHKLWLGWLVTAVNASWGFLGNILGLATHVASHNCYPDNGRPDITRRTYYARYAFGLSLKDDRADPSRRYAFTGGAVVSSRAGDYERHEAVHVRQHLIAGPVFVLSHAAWDVVAFFLVGPFGWLMTRTAQPAGPGSPPPRKEIGYAIEEMAYFNNPWEIHAYSRYLNGRDWDPSRVLLFRSPADKVFMVVWVVLVTLVLAGAVVAWVA